MDAIGNEHVYAGARMKKPQGFGIDEHRYITVTEFVAQSNRLIHRKGR
ncbi:MAG: hypothetical protein KKG76_05850 [Euryarchaeota archaeon]|nr:hypothetical protein [Euryarchaeota archaeon]MBU4139017.1 hypothetical protein [Euryarchaeota archaeon]